MNVFARALLALALLLPQAAFAAATPESRLEAERLLQTLDMASAVRNAISMLGLPVETAVRMASTYPAEFLGLGDSVGRIAPGYRANLVHADSQLQVLATWIDGVRG